METDMGNLIQQLVDLVQKTAPELWRIALLQVKGDVIETLVWALVSLAVGIGLFILSKYLFKSWYKEFRDNDSPGAIMCIVFGVVAALVFVGVLVGAIKMIVNPEYYAIQSLMYLIQ
ncbi:MAG: hypothetical protein WC554_09260 [Clostridia bacterium]